MARGQVLECPLGFPSSNKLFSLLGILSIFGRLSQYERALKKENLQFLFICWPYGGHISLSQINLWLYSKVEHSSWTMKFYRGCTLGLFGPFLPSPLPSSFQVRTRKKREIFLPILLKNTVVGNFLVTYDAHWPTMLPPPHKPAKKCCSIYHDLLDGRAMDRLPPPPSSVPIIWREEERQCQNSLFQTLLAF